MVATGEFSPQTVQVASNTHAPRLRPKVQELPHTASNSPLVLLMSCLSLLFGGALTIRRVLPARKVSL